MTGRLQQLKEAAERAAAEHNAKEQVIEAIERTARLRRRFIDRYGYDPMTYAQKKSPAGATRQDRVFISLVGKVRVTIHVDAQ